jgi:hypothetical protein
MCAALRELQCAGAVVVGSISAFAVRICCCRHGNRFTQYAHLLAVSTSHRHARLSAVISSVLLYLLFGQLFLQSLLAADMLRYSIELSAIFDGE